MLFSIDHFTAPNDIVLRYGIAGPQNPRAHVLILQGRGEFIERYDETAHELAERGLGCITLDFRGQGGSARETPEPKMGYVADLEHYCQDVHHVMSHVAATGGIHADLVLTHSTGGLVGMQILLRNPAVWKSAVMIAPFFGLGGPDWLAVAAQFLSGGLCRYGFDKQYLPGQKLLSPLQPFTPENVLTSDRARYDRNVGYLKANPALLVGGVSAGWLDACFRAQAMLSRQITETADQSPCVLPPISMILAGNDQVVDNQATEELFGRTPSVTITEIPEARHEILQEQDHLRDRFWAAFDLHVSRHHPDWYA